MTSPGHLAPDGGMSGGSPGTGGTSGTSSGGIPSTGGVGSSTGGTSGSGGTPSSGGVHGSGASSSLDGAIDAINLDSGDRSEGHRLGGACESDHDCAPKLHCLGSTSHDLGGGGPAGGLCTVDCSQDDVCSEFDAICLSVTDTTAFCFEPCTIGSSDPNKCSGRVDMACNQPIDADGNPESGPGYCAPSCGSDADCKGRKCDLASGYCADTTTGTGVLPLGAACDPNLMPDHCTGACVTFLGGLSLCSGLCSLGTIGCDQSQSSPTPSVACDIPSSTTATTGDSGYCGPLCDCDADCLYPGFVCEPLPQVAQAYGREGQCVPPTGDSGEPVSHIPCN